VAGEIDEEIAVIAGDEARGVVIARGKVLQMRSAVGPATGCAA
jgi:hypothetical protein